MKTYKLTKSGKYLQIVGDIIADWSLFALFPLVLFTKTNLYVSFLWIVLVSIIVLYLHYRVDRKYYPFFVELYSDKVRIRHRKEVSFRPFFMAKFVDVTINFQDIVGIKADRDRSYASIYFYLKDNGYFSFSSINPKTLLKIYTDLNQALEEYRKNEDVNTSQL